MPETELKPVICPCGALLSEVSADGLESTLVGGMIGVGGVPCCHVCHLPLEGESDPEFLLRKLRTAWFSHPDRRSEIKQLADAVRANEITLPLCRTVLSLG